MFLFADMTGIPAKPTYCSLIRCSSDGLEFDLDGAEDCRWIYNALIEYTMGLYRMGERAPDPDERQDCTTWLAELEKAGSR